MVRGKYVIVDQCPGTELSLETLEDALKKLAIEHSRDKPIKIYELHEYLDNPFITRIGFYFKSPNLEAVIGPSFWVPDRKRYSELIISECGRGTWGYIQSVAMIYRYLNFQPRVIVETDGDLLRKALLLPDSLKDVVSSLAVVDIIEEDEGVNKRILGDLGTGKHFSFIVLDTESTRSIESPQFILGCTWDFYHGTRVWEEGQEEELAKECNLFDKIVTYNGNSFDLRKVLRPHAPREIDEILERKSIDLYQLIRYTYDQHKKYRRKGELTLANVAFATLGLSKWEVYYEPEMDERREPIDDDLVDHCARDVEMTKELFFYILTHRHVYYVSYGALYKGRIVDTILINREQFWNAFDSPVKIDDMSSTPPPQSLKDLAVLPEQLSSSEASE